MSAFATAGLLLAEGSLIDPNPGLSFWTLVTFLLVAVLLGTKVWGPLMHSLETREKSIHDAIAQAQKAREDAEKLVAEQKAAAQAAQAESARLVAQARAEVEATRAQLITEARAEAEAERARVRKELDEEKRKALAEVRVVAADVALAVASKILSQEMTDARHQAMASQYVAELGQTVRGRTLDA
jgi:F-type H+-transporting ATPase subunit b